jgi:hypothetical protein
VRRPTWRLVAAIVGSSLVTSGLALTFALRANAESDRKVCGLVVVMDDAYGQAPAQTPAGRKIQTGVDQLRRDLGCTD